MNNDGLKTNSSTTKDLEKKVILKRPKKGSFCEKHKSKTLYFLIISNWYQL